MISGISSVNSVYQTVPDICAATIELPVDVFRPDPDAGFSETTDTAESAQLDSEKLEHIVGHRPPEYDSFPLIKRSADPLGNEIADDFEPLIAPSYRENHIEKFFHGLMQQQLKNMPATAEPFNKTLAYSALGPPALQSHEEPWIPNEIKTTLNRLAPYPFSVNILSVKPHPLVHIAKSEPLIYKAQTKTSEELDYALPPNNVDTAVAQRLKDNQSIREGKNTTIQPAPIKQEATNLTEASQADKIASPVLEKNPDKPSIAAPTNTKQLSADLSKGPDKILQTDKGLEINRTVATPALKPPAAATMRTLTAPNEALSDMSLLEVESVLTSMLDLEDYFKGEQLERSTLPNESYTIRIDNLWISFGSEPSQSYTTKHKAKVPRQKQKPKTDNGKQAERKAQMESNLAVTNALRAMLDIKRHKLDKSKRRDITQTPRMISKEQIDRLEQIESNIAATNALRDILGITRKKRDKGNRH